MHRDIALDTYRRLRSELDQLDREIDGIEAASYLRAQLAKVDSFCMEQAQAYPSNWWALLLRHISPTTFDCASGNYTSYRGYTEFVSSTSKRQLGGNLAEFPIGEPQIKRCLRLVVSCAFAEDMSRHLAYVNSGARLVPNQEEKYEIIIPEALNDALEKYDLQLRLNDSHGWMSRTGEVYFSEVTSKKDDLSRVLVGISMPVLPITGKSLQENPEDDLVQFYPDLCLLNPALSEFKWDGNIAPQGISARVLASTMRVAFVDLGVHPRLWQSLHETGLTVKRSAELEDYLKAIQAEVNDWGARIFPGKIGTIDMETVRSVLTAPSGARAGRYFGPALRYGPDFFCIDLLSVVLSLEGVIAAATAGGGSISSRRALSWERTVQSAIDRTSWRPRGAVRDLISRRLKKDGKVYTDVDAVAARGREMVIVSCKSWQLASRYWVGDFSARRNKEKDVIEAARKLYSDIQTMANFGDQAGFRFSESHSLRGIVCISMPILITPETSEDLEREAPGIQIVTLAELESILSEAEKTVVDPVQWRARALASYRLSGIRGHSA